MTKRSHLMIGVGCSLLFGVNVIPCVIGALLPDIDIIWGKYFKGNFWLSHRGITHHFSIPLALLVLSLVYSDFSFIFISLSLGYFSHLFADALTPTGIPFFFSYYPRFSLKIVKTGSLLEFLLVICFFTFCICFYYFKKTLF